MIDLVFSFLLLLLLHLQDMSAGCDPDSTDQDVIIVRNLILYHSSHCHTPVQSNNKPYFGFGL